MGKSAQCYVAAWMGGEFGGEWIHVYVWLSPLAVHLKLTRCLLTGCTPIKVAIPEPLKTFMWPFAVL